MIKKLLGLIVIVVVVGGGLFYWFVLRNPPAKKLSLDTTSGTTVPITDKGQTVGVTGTWNVEASADTQVGLRINEKFIGGIAEHTAVGRTSGVTGSITIAGTTISQGSFTADLSAIVFTDSPPGLDVSNRKQAIQNQGLDLASYPTGTFKLTKPIDLGSIPKAGTQVTATATGNLTLHGVTKSVTFSLQAEIVNGKIEVASTNPVPVKLSDYNMTPPTFGPVADVSKSGFFEFELVLAKA